MAPWMASGMTMYVAGTPALSKSREPAFIKS